MQHRFLAAALCCILLASSAPARVGEPDHEPRLTDLRGKPAYPFRDVDDAFRVFFFLRTDCPIANSYTPEINRLNAEFAPYHVGFWLVYVDSSETAETVEAHVREYNLSVPAIFDSQHDLVRRSKARVTPEAAVYDREGGLVYHGRIDNGYAELGVRRSSPTRQDLRETLRALVAGKDAPVRTQPGVGCFIESSE